MNKDQEKFDSNFKNNSSEKNTSDDSKLYYKYEKFDNNTGHNSNEKNTYDYSKVYHRNKEYDTNSETGVNTKSNNHNTIKYTNYSDDSSKISTNTLIIILLSFLLFTCIIYIAGPILTGSKSHTENITIIESEIDNESNSKADSKTGTENQTEVKNEDNEEKIIKERRIPGIIVINSPKFISHPNQNGESSLPQIIKYVYHTMHGLKSIFKISDFGDKFRNRQRVLSILPSLLLCKNALQIDIIYNESFATEAKLYANYGTVLLQTASVGHGGKIVFEDFVQQDGLDRIEVALDADPNTNHLGAILHHSEPKSFDTSQFKAIRMLYRHRSSTAVEENISETFIVHRETGEVKKYIVSGVNDNLQKGISAIASNGEWVLKALADGSFGMVNDTLEQNLKKAADKDSDRAIAVQSFVSILGLDHLNPLSAFANILKEQQSKLISLSSQSDALATANLPVISEFIAQQLAEINKTLFGQLAAFNNISSILIELQRLRSKMNENAQLSDNAQMQDIFEALIADVNLATKLKQSNLFPTDTNTLETSLLKMGEFVRDLRAATMNESTIFDNVAEDQLQELKNEIIDMTKTQKEDLKSIFESLEFMMERDTMNDVLLKITELKERSSKLKSLELLTVNGEKIFQNDVNSDLIRDHAQFVNDIRYSRDATGQVVLVDQHLPLNQMSDQVIAKLRELDKIKRLVEQKEGSTTYDKIYQMVNA
mgnify:CR=1 FL=1